MKASLLALIMGLALQGPVWSQTPEPQRTLSPPPVPTRAQTERWRDLVVKFGGRLVVLNRERQLLARLSSLISPEQQAVMRQIKVTPEQGVAIIQLLQDTLPTVLTQQDSPQAVKEMVVPRLVKILGPEQIDLILQLNPTPQQIAAVQSLMEEMNGIWRSAGAGLDQATVEEFRATLTPEQRQWLDLLEGLIRR